jgi:hypothetical protein
MAPLLAALLFASTTSAHAGPAASVAWSAEEQAVGVALSVRHDPPSCEVVRAQLPSPEEGLVRIAEAWQGLPWVAMRAAACAATLPASTPALRRWLVDPALAGLADAAIGALTERARTATAWPVDAELARVALTGPHQALARRHFAASGVTALKRLAEP